MRFPFIITLLGLASLTLIDARVFATSKDPCDDVPLAFLPHPIEDLEKTTYVPTSLVPALKAFVAPSASMGYGQFEDPLKWYQPTPDELTFLSSLNFQPEHLGAALRFRKFITPENTGLFQKVLGKCTWLESQNLMAAALGLSPEVLEEAALISAYQDRCDFLIDTPREDAWVYGMLGSDPYIDILLQGHIKKRIEENPEYVSALFIRNLKEGSDITRMRLTSFLLHASAVPYWISHNKMESRFTLLGYGLDSNVVRTLKKRQLLPAFFYMLINPFETRTSQASLKFKSPDPLAPMPAWTYTPSPFLEPHM